MRIIVFVFIIILGLVSCQPQEKSNRNNGTIIIHINEKSIDKQLKFSQVFNKIKTIILETNQNSIIGRIDKIFLDNNSLYILDKSISQGLFVFDIDGNFRYKITMKGRGPGEFVRIFDFDITANGTFLLVGYPYRIMQFSLSGVFENEQILGKPGILFSAITDHDWLLYKCNIKAGNHDREDNFSLVHLDNEGLVMKEMLLNGYTNSGYKGCHIPEYFGFDRYNDTVLFSPPFSDTIFSYNNLILSPKYIIDFDDNDVKESIFNEMNSVDEQLRSITNSRAGYSISRLSNSSDILFFEFVFNKKHAFCFYKKSLGLTMLARVLYDDTDYIFPELFVTNKGQVVGVISAINLKNQANACSKDSILSKKDLAVYQLANQISTNSNPVIFIYNFLQ